MGGECNYLLRVNPTTYRLEFVPEEAWQTPEMLSWDEDDIKVWTNTCRGQYCAVQYSAQCRRGRGWWTLVFRLQAALQLGQNESRWRMERAGSYDVCAVKLQPCVWTCIAHTLLGPFSSHTYSKPLWYVFH